mmetsp:Transcript_80676/g.237088  ORF Transcript_80676/g.237088 Transcript_80676/m.237088 type:complete len:184 (+) Transcript_80676:64-615(+)
MQLEGLSQLHKQQPASSSHVYYVPASGGPPELSTQGRAAPARGSEEEEPKKEPAKKPPRRKESNLDDLEDQVLEEVKKAVSETPPVLLRRHSWDGSELEAPAEGEPQRGDRERRLAEMILPGLRRELCNASSEQKGSVAQEIAELQHWLGKDVPAARPFLVARRCDKEEERGTMPGLYRSVSF